MSWCSKITSGAIIAGAVLYNTGSTYLKADDLAIVYEGMEHHMGGVPRDHLVKYDELNITDQSQADKLPQFYDYYVRLEPLMADGTLRKDVIVLESKKANKMGPCVAGANIPAISGSPVIMFPEGYAKEHEDYASLALLHEAGHIVDNESILGPSVPLVAATVTAAASFFLDTSFIADDGATVSIRPGFVGATLLTSSVYGFFDFVGGTYWMKQSAEQNADNFANKHATDKELIGGMKHYFDEETKLIVDIDLEFMTKKYRYSGYHPSSDSRFKEIQRVLDERGVDTGDVMADLKQKRIVAIKAAVKKLKDEEQENKYKLFEWLGEGSIMRAKMFFDDYYNDKIRSLEKKADEMIAELSE